MMGPFFLNSFIRFIFHLSWFWLLNSKRKNREFCFKRNYRVYLILKIVYRVRKVKSRASSCVQNRLGAPWWWTAHARHNLEYS